jgi:hypothetical protein
MLAGSAMTKKRSACCSYDRARDVSSGTTFWTKDQETTHDHVNKRRGVFSHKYVNWSNSSGLARAVATKYESLGVKNLITPNKETWGWNEDIVRKFYSTLSVTPDFKEISFMVGTTREVVTKVQFEKTLGIKSITGSINLHDLSKHGNEPLLCKKVCNLQPGVDLIQKINRCTLLPKQGNRGDCSNISIRLANAIWNGEHFDIASFIFTEMHFANGNKKQQLPYGPYIYSLLRGLECITDDNIGEMCFPMEFSSQLLKKSGDLKLLQKQVESLEATNIGLIKQLESAEASNIGLRKHVESFEASNVGLVNQVKSVAATVDKLIKQNGSEEIIRGLEIVGKQLWNIVVQSDMSLENTEVQPKKPLQKCYTRRGRGGSHAPAVATLVRLLFTPC